VTFVLERLVEEKVPGCRAAILLAADGFVKHAYWKDARGDDIDPAKAERLAAMASAISSLAKGLGREYEGEGVGGVRQVTAELEGLYVMVTAPSTGTVLLVLADPEVDVGQLAYEMGLIGKQMPEHLATAARPDVVSHPGIR
jgi:predicted regulator of Ras-like GTPase activity (Roadblock/LC7/MglB family)